MMPVEQAAPRKISGLALSIVGSHTQRINMTPATATLHKSIPDGALECLRMDAFDTRITEEQFNSIRVLPFFVRLFGYAAEKIARQFRTKGGIPVRKPGLFVCLIRKDHCWMVSYKEPKRGPSHYSNPGFSTPKRGEFTFSSTCLILCAICHNVFHRSHH